MTPPAFTEIELAPEGDITALRYIAHLEAGHLVFFQGDLTSQPWWPAAKATVFALIERRNGWTDDGGPGA